MRENTILALVFSAVAAIYIAGMMVANSPLFQHN